MSVLKRLARALYRLGRAHVLHRVIPASKTAIFADGRDGIEVVGFFHSSSGLGESARLCARQLSDNGCKVRCTTVETVFGKPHELEWDFQDSATAEQIGCRIFHLNPPMMPPVVLKMGLRRFARAFNIGYWAWELERLPAEWTRALGYVDAVFCPSDFTSAAVRRHTRKPVITVPHPVGVERLYPDMRATLGIDPATFLVTNVFSFGSSVERKNPQAIVQAFIAAFPARGDVLLVLKTSGGKDTPELKQLAQAIQGRDDIRILDGMWPREQVMGLIGSSDVYISLHRSEGFGLTLAEAMLLGVPVIATDWSGNTDFVNRKSGYPVGYSLVPVASSHPDMRGSNGLRWAEADVAAAGAILGALAADRAGAKQRAAAQMDEIAAKFAEPMYVKALAALKALSGSDMKAVP